MWRDAWVAERNGLLNRRTGNTVPRVRIPLSPPVISLSFFDKIENHSSKILQALLPSQSGLKWVLLFWLKNSFIWQKWYRKIHVYLFFTQFPDFYEIFFREHFSFAFADSWDIFLIGNPKMIERENRYNLLFFPHHAVSNEWRYIHFNMMQDFWFVIRSFYAILCLTVVYDVMSLHIYSQY